MSEKEWKKHVHRLWWDGDELIPLTPGLSADEQELENRLPVRPPTWDPFTNTTLRG